MIRLLIADDERMEREALADIVMRRFEHEVTVEMAENGRKAADTAVLWEADLILMDIEMPGMNGLDAARAVLEQRPECKVIFITAYSLFQYAHEAVHLGACDYLLKPVDPDETEAAIRRAIRQIEAGRRLAELAAEAPEPETAPEQETDPAELHLLDDALLRAQLCPAVNQHLHPAIRALRHKLGKGACRLAGGIVLRLVLRVAQNERFLLLRRSRLRRTACNCQRRGCCQQMQQLTAGHSCASRAALAASFRYWVGVMPVRFLKARAK